MANAIWHNGHPISVGLDVHHGGPKGCWWEAGDKGTRLRRGPITGIVLHHTGGEGDVERVCRTMRNRGCSAHFVIERDGEVWQCADLQTVTYHGGPKGNPIGPGIEGVNRGLAPAQRGHQRAAYKDEAHSKGLRFLRFHPPQVAAYYDLLLELCRILDVPYRFPLDERGRVRRDTLSDDELDGYRGILGHLHLTKRKVDPSPHLLDELAKLKSEHRL